jgi:hypothetical protein
MDLVISGAETFKLDIESTAYPGYISLAELTSFLYLAGVDKELFRRPIDQLLISTPSGRFPDPTALMAQHYLANNDLLINDRLISRNCTRKKRNRTKFKTEE